MNCEALVLLLAAAISEVLAFTAVSRRPLLSTSLIVNQALTDPVFSAQPSHLNSVAVSGGTSTSLNLVNGASAAFASINEAAAQASDAAQRAAEAASSIAVQSSSSMFAAQDPVNGRTLTLYEYVLSGGGTGAEGEGVSRLANAHDKIEIIKENFDVFMKDLNLPDVDSISVGLKAVVEKGAPSDGVDWIGGSSAGMSILQDQFKAVLSSISFDQNAAWYAAGFTLFVALGQRGAGKAVARSELEAELVDARKKADEAAGAAALAAKGAAMAKEVAAKMEAVGGTDGVNANIMLENSRLKQMTVEGELMEDELRKLKGENIRLRSQLDDLQRSSSRAPRLDDKSTDEVAVAPSPQKIVDHDPEENEKILEIIKEVEEANKKVSKGKKKARVAQKKDERKDTSTPKVKAEKKATPKVKAEKKAAPKVKAEMKATPKVQAEKKAVPEVQKKSVTGKGKDWSLLSDSTLRRKTMKELAAYLSDYDVKGMKKGEMINLLRSTSGK